MTHPDRPAAVRVFDERLRAGDGTMLACRTWEPAAGAAEAGQPVALLHHGVATYGATYGRLGEFLAARGIPLCALDARGHGRSGGPRGELRGGATLLRDLHLVAQWTAARYPGRPLLLIGESMGGLCAINYAAHAEAVGGRVAALLLLAPGVLIHPLQVADYTVVRRTPQARRDPAQHGPALRAWRARLVGSRDAAWLHAHTHDPLVLPRVSGRYMWIVSVLSMRVPLAAARWHGPTLILHGRRDGVVPYQSSIMLYHLLRTPDKELTLFPEAWHTLFWDPATPQVLARIEAWLDAHFPPGRRGRDET